MFSCPLGSSFNNQYTACGYFVLNFLSRLFVSLRFTFFDVLLRPIARVLRALMDLRTRVLEVEAGLVFIFGL